MEIKIVRDDISKMPVGNGAIVLPANTKLREGSGASQAIFTRAGREELTAACAQLLRDYGPFDVGTAVPTPAYNLDAKCIIHAIVPKWIDGHHQEYERLCAAYFTSLELADNLECETIAFPILASGNNHFSKELAFKIATESLDKYQPKGSLKKAILVIYNTSMMERALQYGYPVTAMIPSKPVLKGEVINPARSGGPGTAHSSDRMPQRAPNPYHDRNKAEWNSVKWQLIHSAVDVISKPENMEAILKFAAGLVKGINQNNGQNGSLNGHVNKK